MRCVIEARRGAVLAIAAAVWMCPVASWGQTASTGSGPGFPSKPVRYIVPFGAGGSPDIVARLVAERLTRLWGQQVIVENRVGVAGVMGTAFVAKSPPYGHTIGGQVPSGTIDALLAQLCIRHSLVLLTTDNDFVQAAGHCALHVWKP